MTLARLARRCVVVLSGCLVASSLVAASNAAPAASEHLRSANETASQAAGGMYGGLGGGAQRTVPKAAAGPAPAAAAGGNGYQNWKDGGTVCGVYANSAGMGSYCSDGSGSSLPRPLVERFPNWAEFENCRFEDPPPGVDVPPNPAPDEEKWQLRTCLTAIDWFTWNGGGNRRVIMDLVLIDIDTDTSYEDTPLSRFLWDTMQTMYPVPMLRVQPKTYPVVGQRAYLTFDWLDTKTREPISEGPYKNDPNGGPFVMHQRGGITMRARAVEMRIDPQIKGVEPFECTVPKLGYDKSAPPDPDRQPSDCYHVFERSSAAAPEISTAEAHLKGDHNVFRMEIDITWRVRYGSQSNMNSLGNYHMLVYQDLPVQDVEAINEPMFDLDLG